VQALRDDSLYFLSVILTTLQVRITVLREKRDRREENRQSLFSLTAYRGSNGPGKFLLSKVT